MEIEISCDKTRLDVKAIIHWLRNSYWAKERPEEKILGSIRHSWCLGAYHGAEMVGFARVVTDYHVFSYLCDVIVAEQWRGRGIGKQMVAFIVMHPDLKQTRFCLATKDAHGLYEPFGFQRVEFMRTGG